MYSIFNTPNKKYVLKTEAFVCNRFGLAEFFAKNYELFEIKQGLNVLDVGCGVFPIGIYLAEQKNNYVTGIELSPVAYKCAINNVCNLNLDKSVKLINGDFTILYKQYNIDKFDLIVSNPPLDNKISREKILKYASNTFKTLDDESYSYLTNSWHSPNGKDLTEYIFESANEILKQDGKIIIVFCDIDCTTPDYVYEKAELNNFLITKQISSQISSDDIGVRSTIVKKFNVYMMEFGRQKYDDICEECLC